MDEEASIGLKIREFVYRNILFVSLIVIGILLCVVGGVQYLGSKNSKPAVEFISAEENEKSINTSITVDVEGEVVNPGVYTIGFNSRLKDAIDAAGGFTDDADSGYISKRLNLAQVISDGAKIYIPKVGELDTDASVLGSNSINGDISTDLPVNNSGLININTASLDQLDTLPQVGPVTAQKIVDSRPYGSISELVSKKVVGQKTFDGLKEMITAN